MLQIHNTSTIYIQLLIKYSQQRKQVGPNQWGWTVQCWGAELYSVEGLNCAVLRGWTMQCWGAELCSVEVEGLHCAVLRGWTVQCWGATLCSIEVEGLHSGMLRGWSVQFWGAELCSVEGLPLCVLHFTPRVSALSPGPAPGVKYHLENNAHKPVMFTLTP